MNTETAQDRYLSKPGRRKAHRIQLNIRELIRGIGNNQFLGQFTGISNKKLLEHFESNFEEGMTWENYGCGVGCWQVDHIKPKHEFDLGDPEQLRRCFHYSNLHPRWASENAAYERTAAVRKRCQAAQASEARGPLVDLERAEKAGITVNTVKCRKKRGWPESRWYEPNKRDDYVNWEAIQPKADELGIPLATIKKRRQRGWPESRWFEPTECSG